MPPAVVGLMNLGLDMSVNALSWLWSTGVKFYCSSAPTHGFGLEQNLQSSIFREKLALYVLVHYYNAYMSMSLLILNRYFSTKFQASSHYFNFLTDLKYKIGVELWLLRLRKCHWQLTSYFLFNYIFLILLSYFLILIAPYKTIYGAILVLKRCTPYFD